MHQSPNTLNFGQFIAENAPAVSAISYVEVLGSHRLVFVVAVIGSSCCPRLKKNQDILSHLYEHRGLFSTSHSVLPSAVPPRSLVRTIGRYAKIRHPHPPGCLQDRQPLPRGRCGVHLLPHGYALGAVGANERSIENQNMDHHACF